MNGITIFHLRIAVILITCSLGNPIFAQTEENNKDSKWIEQNMAIPPNFCGELEVTAKGSLLVAGQSRAPKRVSGGVDNNGLNYVSVFEWDSTKLEAYQPTLNDNPENDWIAEVQLAKDANDYPIVAWMEGEKKEGAPLFIKVKQWSGKSFQSLGDVLNVEPIQNAYGLSLTVDRQNHPVIAWAEAPEDINSYESRIDNAIIYVRRWNGNAWQNLGTPLSGLQPQLTLDSDDKLYLAYAQRSDARVEGFVKYLANDNSWHQEGTVVNLESNLSIAADNVSLTLDQEGTPFVGWVGLDLETQKQTFVVQQWIGDTWKILENIQVEKERIPTAVKLISQKDTVVVAFTEDIDPRLTGEFPHPRLYVKAWRGNAWYSLGDAPIFENTQCLSIALDKEGNPVVSASIPGGIGQPSTFAVSRYEP